ncbi:hypothetical protein L873DRAFT_1663738 [Choiromyces venosus 120613-1]|uniref:RRM domain-containing protein n=1 Tax=Choiromyces venosus 120613-1 TaxID=1336337 RepID=A0A3N4K3N5_9PEZI|nr:hypothetical protein L873DRAFT_1663738 [Choiromyces venosus 120613-1]
MPPDRSATGKIVFVGNIPYGLTEEQITEIFSSVGRVLSFRLVYDRETGRPKGFGFAEYSDQETAASAVRNLDNHEIMGRKLRVDFSHEGNATEGMGMDDIMRPGSGGGVLPTLPPGADLPAGLNAPDAISRTLSALQPPQLLDILGQMKALVTTDPLKATELLRQAPQLSYAIFQALLLMNLVDTSVLTQVIENAQPSSSSSQQQQQQPTPIPSSAAPVPTAYAPQYVPPPAVPAAPTPPQQQSAYTPAPAQAPLVADPQRAALIQQVLSLTPEQIGALPADQQSQIMLLKHQLVAGGGF